MIACLLVLFAILCPLFFFSEFNFSSKNLYYTDVERFTVKVSEGNSSDSKTVF